LGELEEARYAAIQFADRPSHTQQLVEGAARIISTHISANRASAAVVYKDTQGYTRLRAWLVGGEKMDLVAEGGIVPSFSTMGWSSACSMKCFRMRGTFR